MANYTPNYQLHQWEPEDPFLRTDFNQDLSKIDTALGSLADKTTALEAAVALCGNCQIEAKTYTGNGSTTNKILFQQQPILFIIQGGAGIIIGGQGSTATVAASGASTTSTVVDKVTTKWNGAELTLSNDNSYFCLNATNVIYHVWSFYFMH